jgi:hypothetical protein
MARVNKSGRISYAGDEKIYLTTAPWAMSSACSASTMSYVSGSIICCSRHFPPTVSASSSHAFLRKIRRSMSTVSARRMVATGRPGTFNARERARG